jgi:hypothetical protein
MNGDLTEYRGQLPGAWEPRGAVRDRQTMRTPGSIEDKKTQIKLSSVCKEIKKSVLTMKVGPISRRRGVMRRPGQPSSLAMPMQLLNYIQVYRQQKNIIFGSLNNDNIQMKTIQINGMHRRAGASFKAWGHGDQRPNEQPLARVRAFYPDGALCNIYQVCRYLKTHTHITVFRSVDIENIKRDSHRRGTRPASRREEVTGPGPTMQTSLAMRASTTLTVPLLGTESSNPSSPVYLQGRPRLLGLARDVRLQSLISLSWSFINCWARTAQKRLRLCTCTDHICWGLAQADDPYARS